MIAANVLPTTSLESFNTSPTETLSSGATVHHPTPSSNTTGTSLSSAPPQDSLSSTQCPEELASCDGLLLSKELIHLKLPPRETDTAEREGSAPNPSYLLTPPDTPNIIDHCELVKTSQLKWVKSDGNTPLWSSSVDANDEGRKHLGNIAILLLASLFA